MNYELLRSEFANITFENGKRDRLVAIISSILCVIFLVIIIILAVRIVYSNTSANAQFHQQAPDPEQRPDEPLTTTPLPIQPTTIQPLPEPTTVVPLQQICTTEECIRSSLDIIVSMNESIDPCDDFYRFTCDRWSSEHINHKWFPSNSDFDILEEKLTVESIKYFQKNGSADEIKPVRQTRDMYQGCMDDETRDNYGYAPVFKYLSQLGLPAVPRYFNMTETKDDIKSYKFDWIKTDAAMNKLLNLPLFINCEVDKNMYDTSKNTIVFGVPQANILGYHSLSKSRIQHDRLMAIEEALAIKNNSIENKLNDARVDFIVFIMTKLISEKYDLPDDFNKRIRNAFYAIRDFDDFLSWIKNETENASEDHYSIISVNELQNDTTGFVRAMGYNPENMWKPYLYQLFDGMNVSLDLDGKDMIHILSHHKLYYDGIAYLVTKELDAKIELWAWWIAVKNLILHTTSEAREKMNQILDAVQGASKPTKEVSCATLTNNYMDYAVTYAIADKSFLKTTKPKVEQMWNNIKEAFGIRVKSLTWMDDKTKSITIEKSKSMKDFIGFPEWLLNNNLLENYYSTLNINAETHLDNLIETVKLRRKLSFELLHVINKKEWHGSPMMVNAFNSLIGNTITIPMAIINYPFYNRGLDVLNYGSLGLVLGHELTHGFDNSGRKYDKNGNFKKWWSNSTIDEFYNKELCFVKQYNDFYVPEIDAFINGEISLGENIADNGGLHHAYLAYQNHKKNIGIEMKLPGLEKYTNDQLFFISYANAWCDEENVYNLKRDVKHAHCPNKYRVLGTLMNSEEFSTAFKCPVGSQMNPISKCDIW